MNKMPSIEELAEDAGYAISDLMSDNALARFDALPAVAKVQHRYLHADCDDFALILHRAIGWGVRAITSPKGALHRLVESPDGRLLDASGWTSLDAIAVRYKAKQLFMSEPGGEELCHSSIDCNEEAQPVIAAMLRLGIEPFTTELRLQLEEFAASVDLWLDNVKRAGSPSLSS